MGSTRKITRKETIVSLLAITIAIAFFEILHFHLYETDLIHIPLFYNGDALFSSAIAKTYMETGANYFNPRLGAPFGSNLLGYPSLVVSGLLGFHQTVLGLFTQNPFLIVLIRLLAGIFLIAYITYFVFRQMGVDNLYAALGSVAYATCHYVQMRSLGHFSLAMVQYLPLGLLLLHWMLTDPAFFRLSKRFFCYRRNRLALLFLYLITCSGIAYYPFFYCFFLLLTAVYLFLRSNRLRDILPPLLCVAMVVVFFAINLSPAIYDRLFGDSPSSAVYRNPYGAELYGLKITTLLLSPNASYLPSLTRKFELIMQQSAENENTIGYLGFIGIAGLFGLVLRSLRLHRKNSALSEQLTLMSGLLFGGVLLATIGGGGVLIAYFITPMIRGYTRISAFIALFCIAAACIYATIFMQEYKGKRKPLYAALIVCFFLVGICEQKAWPYFNVEQTRVDYQRDIAFGQTMESMMPEGAMIMQLPYAAFPESPAIVNMEDYSHFTAYLSTPTLRFSYGAMKGSAADYNYERVASLEMEEMLEALCAQGFSGLYIDRSGYTEEDLFQLEGRLTALLGTEPTVSIGGGKAVYSLVDYSEELQNRYGAGWKNQTNYWSTYAYYPDSRIYQLEEEKDNTWRWSDQESSFHLVNTTDHPVNVRLHFALETAVDGSYTIDVKIGSERRQWQIGAGNGEETIWDITLEPGEQRVDFTCSAPLLVSADPRNICFRFNHPEQILEVLD